MSARGQRDRLHWRRNDRLTFKLADVGAAPQAQPADQAPMSAGPRFQGTSRRLPAAERRSRSAASAC
jgi:hypothetical protein